MIYSPCGPQRIGVYAAMNDLDPRSSGNEIEVEPARSDGVRDRLPAASGREDAPGAQRTIGEAIRAHAKARPGQPAVVASRFAPLSYAELQQQIDEIGVCLRQAGFDRHSRIAVGIANSAEATLAIVAVAAAAAAVPLDPKLTFAEVERCLRILCPNAVLVPRGADSTARKVAEHLRLPIIEASVAHNGRLGLRLTVPTVGAAAPSDDPDPGAPAFILHTSGTTADPNLVPFSHRNMLAAAERVKFWFRLTPQDRCLSVSPLYYSHGITTTAMTPLLTGGSIAIPVNMSIVDLSEWFGTLQPTWYSAGPTLHLSVLEKAKARSDARAMHALRFISSAGAALPVDVHDGLRTTLGVPVLEHYGSSETAHISANMLPPGPSKPGTCGRPWPDTVIIVDVDARRLPPGQEGEILVGGPTVMSGYLNVPELNRSAFVDGWYRTGDIGSLDAEGFLSLRGRMRELINRGSEKIAPVEIDHALMRHPEVLEAAAYAVRHPRLGEDVAAAVVLRPGASVTPEELREFLGAQLAPFKIPRRISNVDHLPKGITGKVQRKRLTAGSDASSEQSPATGWQAELLQLWKKVLNTEDISVDDDFFERGGDSLLAMDLHMEVERITGQELSGSILWEASTVRQLAKRLARTAGAQPKPTEAAAGGGRSPLVFFHDGHAAGDALLANLQRGLGSEPILAIACHGSNGKAMARSIEDMAAAKLPAILRAQPRGPYRLGGYRAGALVALEAARLLAAAGREVAVVALVDPPTITAHRPAQFLLSLLGRMSGKRPRQGVDGTAGYVPAPVALSLLVFSNENEGRVWWRVSADVELINLPGSRDDWVTRHAVAVTSYLRARLQNIGDASIKSETARVVR
jgi:oxalate---CoA ligase